MLSLLCKILELRDLRAQKVSAHQRLFFWKGGTYLDVNKVRQRNHLFYLEDEEHYSHLEVTENGSIVK